MCLEGDWFGIWSDKKKRFWKVGNLVMDDFFNDCIIWFDVNIVFLDVINGKKFICVIWKDFILFMIVCCDEMCREVE